MLQPNTKGKILIMRSIRVNLGDNGYHVHIGVGLIKEVGHLLVEHDLRKKAVVITDTIVDNLYGDVLEHSLANWGLKSSRVVIPPGEIQKSLETAGKFYLRLAELYADRNTPVLALGGGVIGDLAGFVAATYMRGVPLIHVPTTLLGQVDSSIGGKVAVDHGGVKNMIGAFYQPKLTVADISLIKSLPQREIRNGLAEIIKYALIQDKEFFSYLETGIGKIIALDDTVLEYVIARSADIKARIVQEDEKDTGLRNILNFGHTVGHAMEAVSEFKIGHGEAVALGMAVAAKISRRLKMIDDSALSRILRLIKLAGLPDVLPDIDIDAVIEIIRHDKKIIEGNLRFVLLQSPGNAVISDEVTIELIRDTLVNRNE